MKKRNKDRKGTGSTDNISFGIWDNEIARLEVLGLLNDNYTYADYWREHEETQKRLLEQWGKELMKIRC
jgi:hypothetical protein